jgi:multiple sugar transport system substrate-binding protein
LALIRRGMGPEAEKNVMKVDLTRRTSLALSLGLGLCATTVRAAPVRQLTVAAFPAIDQVVRAAEPAWRARFPDVELKVVSRQINDHHAAMTTALSTATQLPDLMALEVLYLGRYARGRGLEDLRAEPYRGEGLRARFAPFAFQQAINARGELLALPSDIGPGTLLYRHDLLARAGLKEDALTRSWDSFVESGRQIKARTGAYLLSHARDMKDIAIRTGMQPGDGLHFSRDNRVLVNTPRFARAFELARDVRKATLDARIYAWSADWAEGFRRGSIATQMMGAWLAGHLNGWLAPTTRGLWRAAPLPEGSYAAFGGSFFAIPRAADPATKPLAWALLQMLTLDPALQLAAFKAHDAFPALVATYGDPFFDEPIPFLDNQAARRLWRDAAQHITAPAVNRQDAFAEEVINTELDKVLDRGKDITTALGDAERLLRLRATR